MVKRKRVVGVMGGASVGPDVMVAAEALGRHIAERGWVLLSGGRNAGVMAASAKGAKEAGGTVVGILPGRDDADASPHLDLAIRTGMGDARNVINVLSSDVVVVCPGAAGTLSELALALRSGRPVVVLGDGDTSMLAPFVPPGRLVVAGSVEEVVSCLDDLMAGS